MRALIFFVATLVLAGCRSGTHAYPHANDIAWVQPVFPPAVRTVKLRDGAFIDYGHAPSHLPAIDEPSTWVIRCVEANGTTRWFLPHSTRTSGITPHDGADSDDARPFSNWWSVDMANPGPVDLVWGGKAIAADDTHLYVVQFSPAENGAGVVALNLRTGRIAWSSPVQGIGRVTHSRYSNFVDTRIIDGALVIFGDEGAGNYIEVFSPEGVRLSTKVIGDR